MPILELPGGVSLNYSDTGTGMPVLLIAPGGMRSAIEFWQRTPWNPIEQLSPHYRVIAMDQRNAGASSGPVSEMDGWQTYLGDQLALLDALGVKQFHVIGMCIGGPYALGLAQAEPARVASAVLMQSIGLEGSGQGSNQALFKEMFDGWASELKSQHDLSDAQWQRFRDNMFGGDDVLFNVDDAFMRSCDTPLLVFEGNDAYHPRDASLHIRTLARRVRYIEEWKEADKVPAAKSALETFLAANSGQ